MKKVASGLVISTFAIVFMLFVAEGVLRLISGLHLRVDPVGAYLKNPSSPYAPLTPNFVGIHSEPEFVTTWRFNSRGLRDREYVESKGDGFRIAVLGDSFTFGEGVENEETYEELVERYLQEHAEGRNEVINFGVRGWGVLEEMGVLRERVIGYEPDMVIVAFYVNDILQIGWGAEVRPFGSGWRKFIGEKLYLYSFVRTRLDSLLVSLSSTFPGIVPVSPHPLGEVEVLAKHPTPEIESQWETALSVYEEMKAILHQQDIRLVIVYIPTSFQTEQERWDLLVRYFDLDPEKYDLERPQAILEEFAETRGIPFIDLTPAFVDAASQSLLYYKVNGHLTPKGHRVAAQEIYCQLIQRELLPLMVGHGQASSTPSLNGGFASAVGISSLECKSERDMR